MRLRHFSPRTEQAYLGWMRRYHEFHGRRDPAKLGPEHVTVFLDALATRGHVVASTQNQADRYPVATCVLGWDHPIAHQAERPAAFAEFTQTCPIHVRRQE